MTAPLVWPSGKQAIGLAREAVPGTPVAASAWLPVTKFGWNDKPTWLKDMSGRGVMAKDAFGIIQGVLIGELDIEGPVYCDQLGFLVGNLLGDVTATGTATTPTGTLSSLANAGAVSVSSSVSIPSGTPIQIDVGNLAEIVTTSGAPTGAGPYAIPVPALAKAHASSVAITAIQSYGISHAFSTLNSGQGLGQGAGSAQPSTHTITQYYGPAAGSGARQFTNVVFTEISFKWNAETEFLTYSAKAIAWVSAIPGSAGTPSYSTAAPIASWHGLLGLAGPASGGTLVSTCESGEYTIKRAAKPFYTAQNSQNPYAIVRGDVSADWKSTFVVADETPLLYMRNNTQPQHQFVLGNGLAAAAQLGIQVDMQQAAFTEAKPNFGKEAIEYDASGTAVINTANAGYSGGMSPIKVTLTNAVAAGTYL